MKTLALLLALALQQPQTIRVNYVNADLGDVIRSLATVLGVNVVLTDVPSRRITFQTPEPVPAPQVGAVLEAILESQGLVIVQTGPVAQVMPEDKRPTTGPVRVGKELPTPPPLGLVTQIVPLDYIRAEEGLTLLKQVASKTARVEVVPRSNAVLITDRGVHIARYLDLLRKLDVKTGGEAGLRTYVYPLKHASAAELATTLGQVFGAAVAPPPPRARVQALEARSQYGINWQVFTRRGIAGDSTGGIGVGVGAQNFADTLLRGAQGLAVRVVSLASLNVRGILQALATRTNVRVLSTPRILALNNEEARILVGSEVPFVSSTFGGLTAQLNTVVQFRNVGTQLTVIPTVNNDGYVTFRLLQEVSALSQQTVAAAQNAPIITTREAETSAIVKTGHTVVIGGLIGETQQVVESGVPLLKDPPLLRYLFKRHSVSRERTEIAIFFTPYVVFTDEQADSLLQGEREKLQGSKQQIDSVLAPVPPHQQ